MGCLFGRSTCLDFVLQFAIFVAHDENVSVGQVDSRIGVDSIRSIVNRCIYGC